MHDELIINLNDYDHVPEKSVYNNNYYAAKEGRVVFARDIYIHCEEYENTVRIYRVKEDGQHEFLICDYCYSDYKDDDIYSGIIGDWWT